MKTIYFRRISEAIPVACSSTLTWARINLRNLFGWLVATWKRWVPAASTVLVVISAYADVGFFASSVCQYDGHKGTCRFLHLGNIPSLENEKEWMGAARDSNCETFRAIARRGGPFSAQAKLRFDLGEMHPARKVMAFPQTVLWQGPPDLGLDEALEESRAEAAGSARSFCSNVGQAYGGEFAPGRFKHETVSPQCEQHRTGFACRSSGHAQCQFIIPEVVRVCPA